MTIARRFRVFTIEGCDSLVPPTGKRVITSFPHKPQRFCAVHFEGFFVEQQAQKGSVSSRPSVYHTEIVSLLLLLFNSTKPRSVVINYILDMVACCFAAVSQSAFKLAVLLISNY